MKIKVFTLIKFLALLCALAALVGLAACEMPYKIVLNVPEEAPPPGEDFPPGEEHPPGEKPPPGEGEIFIEFEAERTNLDPGECTMLHWAVEGGDFGAFMNGEAVESAGKREICLEEPMGYVLEVDMGESMEVRTVEIMVGGQPGEELPPVNEQPIIDENPVPIGSPAEAVALMPVMPIPIGEPVTLSNDYFQVTMSSEYAYFDGLQMHDISILVTDLAGSDNSFAFFQTLPSPEGWADFEPFTIEHPLPGKEGRLQTKLPPLKSPEVSQGVFSYEVSSPSYPEKITFDLTVEGYPQIQDFYQYQPQTIGMVRGKITDASTGQPIVGAEVSMWLGASLRVMPVDMLSLSDAVGEYTLQAWDIEIVRNFYAPHIDPTGYVLMVQKAGYQTYVHNYYIRPRSGGVMLIDISLKPLEQQMSYDLKWETELWSPGVWEIEMTDAWDRFVVAMGKHPDPDDPETLPTDIPLIDGAGNILWSKPLHDQSWAVDISSDGSYVACGTHAYKPEVGNYAYLWDANGNELWRKSPSCETLDIAISPDNQYVAFGPTESDASLGFYNIGGGEEQWNLDTGFRKIRQVAFTPDGQRLLTGPVMHLVSLDGQTIWRRNEFSGLPYIIWASADMARLMIPDKGDHISMYDAANGELLWRHEQRIMTYGAMSDDGSLVLSLSHNGDLYCYDGDGDLLWYRRVPIGDAAGGAGHNGLDITPDGRYIVVGGGNYTTLLYDRYGNVIWQHRGSGHVDRSEHPYKHSTMAVRISPDGTKIISGYGASDPSICYFERRP